MGQRGAHGSFAPYATCRAWRLAINAGHYDYVVVTPTGFGLVATSPTPRELTWTRDDPHSRTVLLDGPVGAAAVLLHLTGPLDPNSC
jgi:hypothetical protein